MGTKASVKRLAWAVGLVVGSLWLAAWMALPISRLWDAEGWKYASALLKGFLQPSLSPAFVSRVCSLMLESLAIGALGMVGALLLAVPLALAAARLPVLPEPPTTSGVETGFSGCLRWCARVVLLVLRGIPALIWAFLFVRIFGLGPAPAVFAIALSSAGIIGKLYAELAESVVPGPLHSLQAAGVGWWGRVVLGVLPQVGRQWIGYAWFRLECALRSAAILGIVGAGGIGTEIALSLRYFQFDRLATALLAVLCVIALFELLSATLRCIDWRWSLGLLALGGVAAAWQLALPWSSLWEPSSILQVKRFVASFASPQMDGAWLWKALVLMGQTLAMAWLATFVAAVVAFLLSPLATSVLWGRGALVDSPDVQGWRDGFFWCLLGLVRLVFQLCRALPALVWALFFVLWVGPGILAGTLAIACHTIGVLGRLFGEVYTDTELDALRSLEASGVSMLGRWLFGLLPTVAPRLLAFASFRFEVNLRATAVLGFVGAGGIGDAIHTALSLFHFRRLASLLLVLLLCVLVVDTLGHVLRHRLLRAPTIVDGDAFVGSAQSIPHNR